MSILQLPARLLLLTLAACTAGWAQSPKVVCDHGIGHFEATYPTGVTVRVAPVKAGAFATRACEAELRWGTNRTVVVPSANQIDIDVFGADLGFGVPVVAFVVQPTEVPRKNYEIWSIDKKPRSLYTLTGQNFYRAVDADFNGQVALWTNDSAATQILDSPAATDDQPAPHVALKFEHGRLIDVSAWYRPQYDRQINSLRSRVNADDLADFRNSHSEPDPSQLSARVRDTRATILEIVCAYLYSARPDRAWAELDAAWPPSDLPRIEAAVLNARAHGLEAQVANALPPPLPPKWLDPPRLYQFLKPSGQPDPSGGHLMYGAPGISGTEGPVLVKDSQAIPLHAADTDPVAITLWRPPPSAEEQALSSHDETVLLTIDAVGKVHSAQMLSPASDPNLVAAAMDWKFIPASLDGKPVAFQLRMNVRLQQ